MAHIPPQGPHPRLALVRGPINFENDHVNDNDDDDDAHDNDDYDAIGLELIFIPKGLKHDQHQAVGVQ